MEETLTQRCRVGEEGLRPVKPCRRGREKTVPGKQAPANHVPAAAVRREGRALSGITGRKGRAGGCAGGMSKPGAQPRRGLPNRAARVLEGQAEFLV